MRSFPILEPVYQRAQGQSWIPYIGMKISNLRDTDWINEIPHKGDVGTHANDTIGCATEHASLR